MERWRRGRDVERKRFTHTHYLKEAMCRKMTERHGEIEREKNRERKEGEIGRDRDIRRKKERDILYLNRKTAGSIAHDFPRGNHTQKWLTHLPQSQSSELDPVMTGFPFLSGREKR